MQMIIGGKKVNASSGETAVSYNPATGEALDIYPVATLEDVQAAIDIAKTAQKEWAKTSYFEKSEIMRRFSDLVRDNFEELAAANCKEEGWIISGCEWEVGNIVEYIHDYTGSGATALNGESFMVPDFEGDEGDIVFTRREPWGVVACICPFNCPLSAFVHKVVPALLCGNSVIVKPPTDVPLTILKIADLLLKAGLPGEVLSVVTGSGSKIGAYLSESKDVNLITFTGSVEVGLDIAGRSAKYLRPCLLELGGNDVSIVFEDADVDYAAEQASLKLETAGQVCCSSKRWIVHNSIKSAFIEKAAVYFVNAKVGDPMDRTTRLGPLINEKAAETVESQVNHSISQGAQLVCGGIRDGAFFAPTILDGVTPEMDVATDMEIFGPVISVIGFDTEEEAIEIANNCSMGLNAGIITSNIYRSFRLVSRLEAGTINVNACSMWRTAYAPFGGYKLSGFGRESIENTFKEFSQVKTVRIPVSGSLEKGGFEK